MKRIKITPLTQKVLREHKISHNVYNELGKYEKIAVSTQLRRWGRVSSPNLKEALIMATLKHGKELGEIQNYNYNGMNFIYTN